MKRMLFVLNSEKKWHRIVRRAIVIGVLSAVAVLLNAFLDIAPIYVIPTITALLAGIDKLIRI